MTAIKEIDKITELYKVHNELMTDFIADNIIEIDNNWTVQDSVEWLLDNYSDTEIDEKFDFINDYWLQQITR